LAEKRRVNRFHVFVDNNASPLLAATLGALIGKDGRRAVHIREIEELGPSASDERWIRYVHRQPGDWIALSGDIRMSRNPAERAALRSAGARVLFLSRGFCAHPVNRQCAILLWNWPRIEQAMAPLTPPVLLELGPSISLKLRQVPL
jgi:hypothetical protein